MRKFLSAVLAAVLCLPGLVTGGLAAETGCEDRYCFSAADFQPELRGICITELPATGAMLLDSRVLQPGDILTADQAARMTFMPRPAEEDSVAVWSYLPVYEDRVEQPAVMTIAVRGRTDKAPAAEDSAIETYRNLPNEGLLKAKDPEGAPLRYTLVRSPRRGEVGIRPDGSFIYTPKKNKVGVDSFTYTAADPAGNVSREATVTVTIIKPTDARQYSDTAGKSCRFAAEWMKNTGIFVGESLGGNGCFSPEKEVTQGQFLAMLTGAMEIPLDRDARPVGMAGELPRWLEPYLAAAQRCGLLDGLPEPFRSDSPVTGAQAAVMLQNVLDLTAVPEAEAAADCPGWASDAVSALSGHGIVCDPAAALTRSRAAEMLYAARQIAPAAAGMAVLEDRG